MGFDPMQIPKLRIAHEAGLGIAKPSEIKVNGDFKDICAKYFKYWRGFCLFGMHSKSFQTFSFLFYILPV